MNLQGNTIEPTGYTYKVQKVYDSRLLKPIPGLNTDEAKLRKRIMVGSQYQAKVPKGLCHYDDALPYENDDKLMWDPNILNTEGVESFLKEASKFSNKPNTQLKDDEDALINLQQCGHDVKEALRRFRMNQSSTPKNLWSDEECSNFEAGVRDFKKNFYLIQKHNVRTRSVGELVQFYYLWKKSARHDMFARRTRLQKKKYLMNPGVTDFMERYLEDKDCQDEQGSSPQPSEKS